MAKESDEWPGTLALATALGGPACGSDTENPTPIGGTCKQCGWVDQSYEAPVAPQLTKAELARRLAEPCIFSSDISTLLTADDVLGDD